MDTSKYQIGQMIRVKYWGNVKIVGKTRDGGLEVFHASGETATVFNESEVLKVGHITESQWVDQEINRGGD